MLLKNRIKEFSMRLGDKPSLLDVNHSRVAEKILLHWGYKEFYPFLDKLLVVEKERNGRQGFPQEVLEEIYLLQEIHDKKFPSTQSSNDQSKNLIWR